MCVWDWRNCRIGLFEHPGTVFVVTNLTYADAPRLMSRDLQAAASLNWQEVRLSGSSAHEYAEQIEELGPMLAHGWQTKPSPKTGNPSYVRPSVLVIYREDHKFLLDAVIPKPGRDIRKLRSDPCLAAVAGAHVGEVQGRKGAWPRSPAVWRRAAGSWPFNRMATIRGWKSFRSCGRGRIRFRSIATS